ncbi:MAG: hypothetical protein J7L55_00805 [Desulfurococcales archaeon]|nr:hypothetical protein [Desulfurococcales archaeon]
MELPKEGLKDGVLDVINRVASNEPRLGDRRSLGPMMSKPLRASLKAFIQFIDRILNDPSRFTATWKLACEAVSMLNELLGNEGGAGLITYGGSESNLTSLFMLREAGYRTLVVSSSAHISVFKATRVLGMKVQRVRADHSLCIDAYRAASIAKRMGDAAVLITAGNTETGCVDDARTLSDLIPGKPIVVDGAFGGVMVPLLREAGLTNKIADFSVESVVSLSVDGHKSLLTPIPSGALLLRGGDWVKYVSFEPRYLSSEEQLGLLWTRTGGSAASLWASLMYFGKEGLRNLYLDLMRKTRKLYESLLELGFNAVEPELPVLCFWSAKLRADRLLGELSRRGWYLYRCPSFGGLRVTVLPHVTHEVINEFLADLEEVVRKI